MTVETPGINCLAREGAAGGRAGEEAHKPSNIGAISQHVAPNLAENEGEEGSSTTSLFLILILLQI